MNFSPKTPVKDLYSEYVTAKPIDLPDRWDESASDYRYEVWEAVQCEECGKWVVMRGDGEMRHHDITNYDDPDYEPYDCDGYLYSEGPMMSYAYPIDTDRIGSPEAAALAIKHLPLCLIEMDGNYYLALTGGSMDLSWEIAESFMRLGYLPPVHFSNLPLRAGNDLNTRRKWIVAAMRRAIRINMNWLRSDLERLNFTRKEMAARS